MNLNHDESYTPSLHSSSGLLNLSQNHFQFSVLLVLSQERGKLLEFLLSPCRLYNLQSTGPGLSLPQIAPIDKTGVLPQVV